MKILCSNGLLINDDHVLEYAVHYDTEVVACFNHIHSIEVRPAKDGKGVDGMSEFRQNIQGIETVCEADDEGHALHIIQEIGRAYAAGVKLFEVDKYLADPEEYSKSIELLNERFTI